VLVHAQQLTDSMVLIVAASKHKQYLGVCGVIYGACACKSFMA
jgi:hypothetical protein